MSVASKVSSMRPGIMGLFCHLLYAQLEASGKYLWHVLWNRLLTRPQRIISVLTLPPFFPH